MKKTADPRILHKRIRFKEYIYLFCLLLLICSFFSVIFLLAHNRAENRILTALSLITYVFVISLIVTLGLAWFRKITIQIPVDQLIEAARKVAYGDYTVRLKQSHVNEKKDEFDILFEDFNTMVDELASTELLKKDFISNVSHELKTPLSIIENYATILQSDGISEDEKIEYARKIGVASRRLSDLITRILQLSRLENQKIVTNKIKYNLSEQLSRCALGFEQMWEEKEIEINVEFDQSIWIENDEELLDIVWNNLISNALKFTDKGGEIDINLKKIQNQIIVNLEDNGCGMDEITLQHMFDKFFQGDTSHATIGNGLGLTLVYRILTLLKAEIKVESNMGKGTNIMIIL